MQNPLKYTGQQSYMSTPPLELDSEREEYQENEDMVKSSYQDGVDPGFKKLLQGYLQRETSRTKWSLLMFSLGIVVYFSYEIFLSRPISVGWLCLVGTLAFCAIVRNAILHYRVKREWFGRSEYEAYELVRFVTEQKRRSEF